MLAGMVLAPAAGEARGSTGGLNETLELRGFTEAGGEYAFSIYNRETGRGHWLWLNEPSEGYEVTNFDPERNTARIRYNNQTATISLERSRIVEYVPDISPRPDYEPSPPPPGETRTADGSGAGGADPASTRGTRGDSSSGQPQAPPESADGNGSSSGEIPIGGGAAPAPPDSPPNDEISEGDDDSDNGPSDSGDPGSPPPLPPTPPPNYTPER